MLTSLSPRRAAAPGGKSISLVPAAKAFTKLKSLIFFSSRSIEVGHKGMKDIENISCSSSLTDIVVYENSFVSRLLVACNHKSFL